MKKDLAVALSELIENVDHSTFTTYEIRKLETRGGTLPKFHQWTNGKQTVSGYEVTRFDTNSAYFFLFIDWHRNENYYLVIYTHDKSTTLAELRQIEEIDGTFHIVWKYNPLKRDGKNNQRKAYFNSTFGSTFIQIKLPSTSREVDEFFDQLFQLCQNRLRADKIVDVFDIS